MYINRWGKHAHARPASIACMCLIFLVTCLLVACGGSSPPQAQTKPTPTPSPIPGLGQQLLTKVGQSLSTAKTLHGVFYITIDGQTFSGIVNTEVWMVSPNKTRTLVIASTVPQFPTGSLVVSNGKQTWQYDPESNVAYTGPVTNAPANGTPGTGSGFGTGAGIQSQLVLGLVQSVFTGSTATLVSSSAKAEGHDAYDVHVVPQQQTPATGTPTTSTRTFDYEGEVYLDKATDLPLKFDLMLNGLGHVLLDLPNLALNQSISESTFTYTPPPGVKVLPLQQANATPTGSLTLAEAQQEAGYHLLSIPSTQTTYQLTGVDALGAPGNQIYTLNYMQASTTFTISEGKPLANLPSNGGQQVSIHGTTATLSTVNGATTLAWTEHGVGIRITGSLSGAAIEGIAKMLV